MSWMQHETRECRRHSVFGPAIIHSPDISVRSLRTLVRLVSLRSALALRMQLKFLMRIVTYNIHKARGLDGRTSITRIAKVLEDLNADVIALQEIFSVCDSHQGQVEDLATELGMKSAFA